MRGCLAVPSCAMPCSEITERKKVTMCGGDANDEQVESPGKCLRPLRDGRCGESGIGKLGVSTLAVRLLIHHLSHVLHRLPDQESGMLTAGSRIFALLRLSLAYSRPSWGSLSDRDRGGMLDIRPFFTLAVSFLLFRFYRNPWLLPVRRLYSYHRLPNARHCRGCCGRLRSGPARIRRDRFATLFSG